MSKPFPAEFRADVVRVARGRDAGVTLEQIASDFGVHPMTLSKWMRQADVDDGVRPGVTSTESAENRELKKRVRLLEQENEVLRRAAAYLSQANLKLGQSPNDVPARPCVGRRRCFRHGDVPGPGDRPPTVLSVVRRAGHPGRVDASFADERPL